MAARMFQRDESNELNATNQKAKAKKKNAETEMKKM